MSSETLTITQNTAQAVRPKTGPKIGLFVTCLVDLMRPSVGFAAVKLLEDAGCSVEVPSQTCCGQPAYNSGDRKTAAAIGLEIINQFAGYDYVVAPSGSCAGMIKKHIPELFADDPNLFPKANALADKTFELISFLTDVLMVQNIAARFPANATYHDSCSGLRELGVKTQPRKLLNSVEGLSLTEMKDPDVCCGFGGTFAIKYGDISDKIVTEKCGCIEASGANLLLAGDLGCLLNMAGKLQRRGSDIEVRHVAEVLTGMVDTPSIGRGSAKEKAAISGGAK